MTDFKIEIRRNAIEIEQVMTAAGFNQNTISGLFGGGPTIKHPYSSSDFGAGWEIFRKQSGAQDIQSRDMPFPR